MPGGGITVIDIGADAVRAVSLRLRKGVPEVVGAGLASIADVELSSPDYAAEVSAAVNRVFKLNNLSTRNVVASIAGRGTMTRYLSLPVVPPWKLSLMMGFEVEEQVGAAKASGGIAYDYRLLSIAGGDDGMLPVFLALAQTPVVEECMKLAGGGARARVEDVDLKGLGAFNLFRRSPQCVEEEVSLLLDVGAEETHLTLQTGSSLCFARTISFGGRQITARIKQELGLLGPEAEEYKKTEACIIPRGEEGFFAENSLKASQACRAEAGALASAVQSSLRFFQGQFKVTIKPAKVFLTGGTAKLGGFAQALGELLRLEAAVFDVAGALPVSGKNAQAALEGDLAHHYASALGTACARLTDGFAVSLLPPKEKRRREFWAREIYVYYAGALALAALLLLFLFGYRDAAYSTARAERWRAHLAGAGIAWDEMEKFRENDRRLHDKLTALRVREASGADLLRCLNILRQNTPDDIFFYEMETSGNIEDDLEETAPDKKKDNKAPIEMRQTESFQKARHIVLRGYIVGAANDNAALDRLKFIRRTLEALPFFEKVESRSGEPLPRDAEEVEKAYAVRLWDPAAKPASRLTEQSEPARRLPVPRGVTLRFALQCWISKEG